MTRNPLSARLPGGPHVHLTELLRHSDWLRGLARSLVFDGNEAEDVFQESMGVALARLDRGDDAALDRSWLAGVVRNVSAARRRRERERGERQGRFARDTGEGAQEAPDRDLELVEQQRMLLDHVQALPPAQRRVVLARYFEGQSAKEIAAQAGTPVSTVRSQLSRGLATLRERLDDQHGGRARWALALAPLAARAETTAGAGLLASAGAALPWFAALAIAAGLAVFLALRPSEAPTRPIDEQLAIAPLDPAPAPVGSGSMAPVALDQDSRTHAPSAESQGPSNPQGASAGSADVEAPPDSAAPDDAQQLGRLVVRCFDAGTTTPAFDIPVSLPRSSGRPSFSFQHRKRTGQDGVAEWSNVVPGKYFVRGTSVVITAGQTTEASIDVPSHARVRGRVVDWDGRGVAGATVSEQTGLRCTADATGHFSLRVTEPNVWIQAKAPGFRQSSNDMLGDLNRANHEVVLTMRRGGASVAGRVLAPDGSAVAGISVRVTGDGRFKGERGLSYGRSGGSVRTDQDGRYEIQGLLPITHVVHVRPGPYGSFSQSVAITSEENYAVDAALPPPLSIYGTVRDADGMPAPYASVAIYNEDRSDYRFTTADAGGTYSEEFLPGDVRNIRASRTPGGKASVRPKLPASGRVAVHLTLDGSVKDAERHLFGRVIDAQGNPLAGWGVIACSDQDQANLGRTDRDGRFSAERERDWMQHLAVYPPWVSGRTLQAFPDVAQSEGEVTLQVTVPFASVRGRVQDRSGVLPDDAEALLSFATATCHSAAVASEGGAFAWDNIVPGMYTLRIQATDRATRSVPVHLAPGESLDLGELAMSEGAFLRLRLDPAARQVVERGAKGEAYVQAADKSGVSAGGAALDPATFLAGPVAEGAKTVQLFLRDGFTVGSAIAVHGEVAEVDLQVPNGVRERVAISLNGLPHHRMPDGGGMITYTITDAATGKFAGAFGFGPMGPNAELLPLPPGRYRVALESIFGHVGETLLDVGTAQRAEPTPVNLKFRGL